MDSIEQGIKDAVKELFNKDRVDLVLGFRKGSLPLRSRPFFVYSEDMARNLVWNSFCRGNLAVYLPKLFPPQPQRDEDKKPYPKIGLVAKGCDSRSITGLIKEHQVPRENIVIIGTPCMGMVDPGKVETAMDGDTVSICREAEGGSFQITGVSGKKMSFKGEEIFADACLECPFPSPEEADIQIKGESRKSPVKNYEHVEKFEALSSEERFHYFIDEISKCIRCYACRQACPNCYCKVCFTDQTKPRWTGAADDLSNLMLFHIGRIFHQAGRCVECDACVNACPMGINLRLFTQKLGKDVKELFDYTPGRPGEQLPLCIFRMDDNQDFITEP
jgi:ferredoxin